MVSPQPAPPVNATGLPPGVEVGGLGKRFLAHLIDRLVLVLLAVAAVYLAPQVGGDIGARQRIGQQRADATDLVDRRKPESRVAGQLVV